MEFKAVYNKDSFSLLSKEEQQKFFDMINNAFSKDKSEFENKLNLVFEEAQQNNIAVVDFLSNLYLNSSELEPNLYFASCMAIYAGANGSKLALDRLKDLLGGVLGEMVNSINKEKLFVSFNLNEENYEQFLLENTCSFLLVELNLNLNSILEMRTHLADYDEFMVLDIEDACANNKDKMLDMLGDVR